MNLPPIQAFHLKPQKCDTFACFPLLKTRAILVVHYNVRMMAYVEPIFIFLWLGVNAWPVGQIF